jgi:cytidylate kinase
MAFNIIAIARTLSAGGEAVGRMVAGELGMRYVDNEIIDQAAALVGVTDKDIAQVEVETRKSLIERILESFAPASGAADAATAGIASTVPGYEQIIVDVIHRTASEGNVVIVAHGAAIALADRSDVLRILVTASHETRMARLIALGRGKTIAQGLIEESDASRAEFLNRFYQLEEEQPTNYDLVVNTDRMSANQVAGMIRSLVQSSR